MKVTTRHRPAIIAMTGNTLSPDSASPRMALRPDSVNARAIVNPDPSRRIIPHGILLAPSQLSSLPPFPSGTINRLMAAKIAMLASVTPGSPIRPVQPPKGSDRVIQATAVTAKTSRTRFSSVCH